MRIYSNMCIVHILYRSQFRHRKKKHQRKLRQLPWSNVLHHGKPNNNPPFSGEKPSISGDGSHLAGITEPMWGWVGLSLSLSLSPSLSLYYIQYMHNTWAQNEHQFTISISFGVHQVKFLTYTIITHQHHLTSIFA